MCMVTRGISQHLQLYIDEYIVQCSSKIFRHVVWTSGIILKKPYIIIYPSSIPSAPADIAHPQVAISAVCVVGMNIV
jgi:hypothetical protein